MSSVRVGLMDPVMAARGRVDAFSRANYLSAVANRVDSYWVPDHINGQTPRPLWDKRYSTSARLLRSPDAAMEAWTLLGSLAARRRLHRIRLGIGVTDTGKRHPATTAQAAATLNLMTRGRAVLGIGPGERVGNEPYGVDWSKPVARFEEALATIRALWDSKGELVNRDSPFFPLRDAMFDLPPHRGRWPEIWVAAHGPRMLRATGRYGDAWFPGFAHYGAAHPMGAGFSGMQDHSAFTLDEETILEKSARVPLDVVKGMMLTGTVDDVLAQAADWRDHGVRYFVVVNFGPMQPSVRGALGLC